MKSIVILGSTGSIGETTLKIIKKYKKLFKIIFLFADTNYKKLNIQSKIFKPKYISLNNKKYLNKLKSASYILNSIDDFLKINKNKIDYVISAVSGYSALNLNFKFLKITKNLLIANKETVICGGKIFLKKAKKFKCKIVPIDSEHYCINFFLNQFKNKNFYREFYLTASGGPFLKKKPSDHISINKVLIHPNWKMGKKISVNSANLTNKIMELFEAHILFNIPIEKLKIKIESSSKIHSIISLKNGLDFLISHMTDMSIPIENSLVYDNLQLQSDNNLSLQNKISFNISDPLLKTFPIIHTGYKILKLGLRAMIIFVVLNDRLVEMFLNKKTQFNYITDKLIKIFNKYEIVIYSKKGIRNLKDITDTINFANNITL